MQGGRLLRLAIGVSIHFPRRPFVITMPAGIKQQRHQRDADQKRKHNADGHVWHTALASWALLNVSGSAPMIEGIKSFSWPMVAAFVGIATFALVAWVNFGRPIRRRRKLQKSVIAEFLVPSAKHHTC